MTEPGGADSAEQGRRDAAEQGRRDSAEQGRRDSAEQGRRDAAEQGRRDAAEQGRRDAGEPVSAVRPFLLTEGRVVDAEQALPMETQLVATPEALAQLEQPHLAFERRAIIETCRVPVSLAELAARLKLHLNVVRVLVGDLHARQLLTVHVPRAAGGSDLDILRRVIDGLRAIHTSGGPGHD